MGGGSSGRKKEDKNIEDFLNRIVHHDILNALMVATGVASLLLEEHDNLHLKNILASIEEIKSILKNGGLEQDIISQIGVLVESSDIVLLTIKDDMIGKLHNSIQKTKQIIDTTQSCRQDLGFQEFILSQLIEEESRYLGLRIILGRKNMSFRTICLFRRVIGNLLQNAIRYGEATQAEIWLEDRNTSIVIIIEDNGKGVPSNRKKEIFENDVSKMGEARDKGLFLIKKILEYNSSLIRETSIPEMDTGARFEISIPKENVISIF